MVLHSHSLVRAARHGIPGPHCSTAWPASLLQPPACPMRSTMLRTLLVLGLVLLSSTRPVAAGFTWQLLSPSGGSPAPAPRSQAACGLIGNELWVFSGAGQPAADVWAFDLDVRTWRRVGAPLLQPAPAARHDAAHGVLQASPAAGRPYPAFIVSHGTRGGSAVLDDTWALWPHNASWTQLPSSGDVPKKRYAPAADIYPGTDLLVMSHGFGKRRYSDVHVYSLSRLSWTKVKSGTNEYDPSKPHSRCLVAGTMVNPASLVLYGGCLQNGFSGGPCPARDAWRLDLDLVTGNPSSSGASTEAVGGSWHEMKWGPSPRTWASLARAPASWGLGAGTAVLLGGSERTKQIITTEDAPDNEVAVLDSTDGSWWRGAAGSSGATPNFRFGACAVTDEAGGRVLLFGGRLAHGSKSLTNDVYALTLSGPPDPAVALPAVQPLSGSGGSALFSPFRRAAGLSAWGTSTHWFTYPQLHGIFMGLSWGIILPLGVLLARHLRHLDPLWFKLHRALQVTGVLLSTIGFVLPWVGGASNPGFAHGIIGILVYFLGLTQPINAYFRPHTGQKWRTQWEYLHKGAGRLAILLGLVNVSLGVMLVDGPAGLWIAWYVILGLGLAAAAGLEAGLQRARRRGGAAAGAGSAATAVLVGKGSSDERDVEEPHYSTAAQGTAPMLELGKVGGGPKHA